MVARVTSTDGIPWSYNFNDDASSSSDTKIYAQEKGFPVTAWQVQSYYAGKGKYRGPPLGSGGKGPREERVFHSRHLTDLEYVLNQRQVRTIAEGVWRDEGGRAIQHESHLHDMMVHPTNPINPDYAFSNPT